MATDRIISLTVGTKEAEEWFRTFQEISELAANLGASHHYVSVSSSVCAETFETEMEVGNDDLYYDENTLMKVREALGKFLKDDHQIKDVINEMRNAGILFRERR